MYNSNYQLLPNGDIMIKRFILPLVALFVLSGCGSNSHKPVAFLSAQLPVTTGTAESPASLDTNFTNIQSNLDELYTEMDTKQDLLIIGDFEDAVEDVVVGDGSTTEATRVGETVVISVISGSGGDFAWSTYPTYSDEGNAGDMAYNDTALVIRNSTEWMRVATLVDDLGLSATPTYTLDLTLAGVQTGDIVNVGGTDYTTTSSITGLSGDVTVTETLVSDTLTWTGADSGDAGTSPWTLTMDSDKALTGTFSDISSIFLSDSFTEASDITLTSHTPETGSAWVQDTTDAMTIVSADGTVKNSLTGVNLSYNTATPTSADYTISAVGQAVSYSTDRGWGICRLTTTWDGYCLQWDGGDGVNLVPYALGVAGSALYTGTASISNVNNHNMSLTFTGTTISWSITDLSDTVLNADSVVDSTYQDAGHVGLWFQRNYSTITSIEAE